MGAAAQVLPSGCAVTAHVVVDCQFRAANLDRSILCSPTLSGDELKLVGLIGKFFAGFVFTDHAAAEGLAFFDNALHALFEVTHEFRSDRIDIPEVIVETIGDEGADSKIDVREHFLNRLSHDVCAGVTQDFQAGWRVQGNCFHRCAGWDFTGEIPCFSINCHSDDVATRGIMLQTGAAFFNFYSNAINSCVDNRHELCSFGFLATSAISTCQLHAYEGASNALIENRQAWTLLS